MIRDRGILYKSWREVSKDRSSGRLLLARLLPAKSQESGYRDTSNRREKDANIRKIITPQEKMPYANQSGRASDSLKTIIQGVHAWLVERRNANENVRNPTTAQQQEELEAGQGLVMRIRSEDAADWGP